MDRSTVVKIINGLIISLVPNMLLGGDKEMYVTPFYNIIRISTGPDLVIHHSMGLNLIFLPIYVILIGDILGAEYKSLQKASIFRFILIILQILLVWYMSLMIVMDIPPGTDTSFLDDIDLSLRGTKFLPLGVLIYLLIEFAIFMSENKVWIFTRMKGSKLENVKE